MKPLPYIRLLIALVLSLSSGASAQGGRYLGPGDLWVRSEVASRINPDLSRWQFWWEVNRDGYLSDCARRGRNDEQFIGASERFEIADALTRAIDRSGPPAVVGAALVALAKVAREHRAFDFVTIFEQHLANTEPAVRRGAVLALGIAELVPAVELLVDLARDTARGRRLCAQPRVGPDERVLACYALGLLAASRPDGSHRERCLSALSAVLGGDARADQELAIAAINATRMACREAVGHADSPALRRELLQAVTWHASRDSGESHALARAHVAGALIRLDGHCAESSGAMRRRLATDLLGEVDSLERSAAAIALGQLDSSTGLDASVRPLARYWRDGTDPQVRSFALMSLARIGAPEGRRMLLEVLASGSSSEKPWAALALGVLIHHRRAERADGEALDDEVGPALLAELDRVREVEVRSAVAVALGLCEHLPAGPRLTRILNENRHRDDFAGYLCLGLAMMQDRAALPPIREALMQSQRRPDLMRRAAVALGVLGDTQELPILYAMLEQSGWSKSMCSAVAGGFQFLDEPRAIRPLVAILENDALSDCARAFAAVALGSLGSVRRDPWNANLVDGLNYRAAVRTLTDGWSGILDVM